MPLSDEEQRILKEIEANLSASDPALVQQVSETTLYRHSARVIRWAVLGFVVGLVFLLATYTTNWILGVLGFFMMLGCVLIIERHLRKLGRAGWQTLTHSMRSGPLGGLVGGTQRRWRERRNRDDQDGSSN